MSDENTRNFNLTLTQISAGAFAATAAAALGSQLGVAGTVVGAALGSVTTTVVSAIYEHSVERSRERVRSLAPAGRARLTAADGRREVVDVTDGLAAAVVGGDRAAGAGTRRRLALAAGVLAAFVLSLMAITGIEAIRGEPLSGGAGTTVGTLIEGAGEPGPEPQRLPGTPAPVPVTSTGTTTGPPPLIMPSTSPEAPSSITSPAAPTSTPATTVRDETSTPAPGSGG